MNSQSATLANELADHLDGIAAALRRFACDLDARRVSLEEGSNEGHGVNPDEAVAMARAIHPLLGSHQELSIRRLAEAHPQGLSASQINPNPNTQPNTYLTLDKLAELKLVRRDDQTHPRRHYLGPNLLANI